MNPIASFKAMLAGLRQTLGKAQAGPDTDPALWFSRLLALPNPDPILRQHGWAEAMYQHIARDAHVLGDIRSIRGNFRSHAYRLCAGNEGDGRSLAALALCEQWLANNRPSELCDWLEVMWQMSSAALYGYMPHEATWSLQDGAYLPQQVIDRPQRRFLFNADAEPLLLSRDAPQGKPVEQPWQFVISRHMPSATNPYGVAVLSSCYWPKVFKDGGWRYFVKYCERHGLPWPFATYPLGTGEPEQRQLEDALAAMMEAGYVMAPEGTTLDLKTPSNSSAATLPQQALIDLCNREMSKAVTSQAMVAELQGVGARAASETAAQRQDAVDNSVRDIAAQSMGVLLRWITLFNFGDGIAPPTLEFFRHEKAGKDRAETYEVAQRLGAKPSKKALLDELGIPEAKNQADELLTPAAATPGQPAGTPAGAAAAGNVPAAVPPARQGKAGPGTTTHASTTPGGTDPAAEPANARLHALQSLPGFTFARAAGMTEDEAIALAADAADQAIEDHAIAPIAAMLAQYEADGRTLAEFQAGLSSLVGQIDDEALREVLDRSLSYAILRGAATQVG